LEEIPVAGMYFYRGETQEVFLISCGDLHCSQNGHSKTVPISATPAEVLEEFTQDPSSAPKFLLTELQGGKLIRIQRIPGMW
jgi:hypothetical protein